MNTKENLSPKDRAIRDYDENFERYWDKAFSELRNATENENKMWLVGPSSYLFSIDGVKFAVDPQIRRMKDVESLSDRLSKDLSVLSFVLITHQHDDHFCAPLIERVRHLPITWYLPSEMSRHFIESVGLSEEKCVFLNAGDKFFAGGIEFMAFNSPHVRKNTTAIMPEIGYYIKTKKVSVLLPADVRDYDYVNYPEFGDVDLCVSHLWAGDNAIDEEAYLPMLDKFVDFSLRFGAKKYFICHLYEIGRKEKYMWHDLHADLAIELFLKKATEVKVEIPRLGCSYELFLTSVTH